MDIGIRNALQFLVGWHKIDTFYYPLWLKTGVYGDLPAIYSKLCERISVYLHPKKIHISLPFKETFVAIVH